MMKKEAFLLFFILFSSLAYADISDKIALGQTKQYITLNNNISISLLRHNSLTERTSFLINKQEFNLLPLQNISILDQNFVFIGSDGKSLKDFTAYFVITNNQPFDCVLECENNSFTDFMKTFDHNFTLCKKDCNSGCNLYKEKVCIANSSWLVDNCGNNIELLDQCEFSCISGECTDCGDKKCISPENSINCGDCGMPDFCIGSSDCKEKEVCFNSRCSKNNYIIGDGICSLPYENCSSGDCSCDNLNIISKGKDDYPIILIHGFASTAEKMKKLQRVLSYDLDYENGGLISISDIGCPSLKKKTVYIATYYEDKNEVKETEKVSDIIQSSYIKMVGEKSEKESTFLDAFSNIIDKVKSCSDSGKVDIITHSMGGLVAREYLVQDDNIKNINKLIFLATPIGGEIYGKQTYELFKGLEAPLGDRKQLLKDCSSIGMPSIVLSLMDGRDVTGECQQMQQAGSTSNPLLNIDETPGIVEYYTISGNIDGKGDGVVTNEGTFLKGAVFNEIVKCNHFNLKDPSKCKEAYSKIVLALGYAPEELKKHSASEDAKEFVLSISDFFSGLFD